MVVGDGFDGGGGDCGVGGTVVADGGDGGGVD